MIRTGLKIGMLACGLTILATAPAMAYFPPPIIKPTAVPPDPFTPPTAGGVGEPVTPDPIVHPTVSTPEPSSVIPALSAIVLLGGYAVWQRRRSNTVEVV